MRDNIFYDTNILVYAYDQSEKEKKYIAEKLVENVFNGQTNGTLSNQILSELFYVLTEKINKPLTKETAAKIIRKYVLSEKWEKVDYTNLTTLRAALNSSYHNSSFWDTLITETMKENGINMILTENEKDFGKMPGIKIINPFKH
jgi:predicted nucleic acid-binding protein